MTKLSLTATNVSPPWSAQDQSTFSWRGPSNGDDGQITAPGNDIRMNQQTAKRVTGDCTEGASFPGIKGGNPGDGFCLEVPLPLWLRVPVMRKGDVLRIEWGNLAKIVGDVKVKILAAIGVECSQDPVFASFPESRGQGWSTSPELRNYLTPSRDR